MRPSPPRAAIALLLAALLPGVASAAPATPAAPDDEASYAPPTPEQLAARERIRPEVEAIFKDMRAPWAPDEDHTHYFAEVTGKLIALGPDVVPFLVAELDLMDPQSFHYCAYALGQLGGAEAEAALRKAVKRAEERGGAFGEAAKRFAVFGLALMGKPDVVDLMQDGLQIQGLVQLPDLKIMSHFAMLTAPQCIPNLLRQLDAYAKKPEDAPKLAWTLQALGYVGDASIAPKIKPMLDDPDPRVREQAAAAYARIAPAEACGDLVSHLGDKVLRVNFAIADGLALRMAKPCTKQYEARLEVETHLDIRASLFEAIAGASGPAALEVLRTYYERSGPAERAVILDTIGRIGSPQGLNLARAALGENNPDVVFNAIAAISRIGGPGAVDTLLALVDNPRRSVVLSAVDELEGIRERRAGPRVAERLLELVREPVGDLQLRAAVAALSDALVTFEYTPALDDLSAAAAKQPDAEIRGSLDSCVRRLTLVKTNGDDVARWTPVLLDPAAEIRQLAAVRLAEIGSKAAVAALAARLASPGASPADRAAIFGAIGDTRCAAAADLVERSLADPAYDAWTLRHARAQTAWAARRIGGSRMIAALRASAVRRGGRDWPTLVYLAVLDPDHAAATLDAVRVKRLRYPDPRFGHEEKDLDKIVFALRAGVVPRTFDVDPDDLARR